MLRFSGSAVCHNIFRGYMIVCLRIDASLNCRADGKTLFNIRNRNLFQSTVFDCFFNNLIACYFSHIVACSVGIKSLRRLRIIKRNHRINRILIVNVIENTEKSGGNKYKNQHPGLKILCIFEYRSKFLFCHFP